MPQLNNASSDNAYEPIETAAPEPETIETDNQIQYWDDPVTDVQFKEDEPDAPQPIEPQPAVPPKDPQDPEGKRFSYWQSEAMKAQNQLKEYQQRLQQVDPYMPIVRYIQENPAILDTIESTLGEPQQVDSGPKRPVQPQKPQTYNAVEAYNDPESESFKYREANEQYREELANYLLKQEEMRQQEAQRLQQERQFIEQRNQQLGQVNVMLTTQYGLSQQDASEFIQLYSDPRNVTLDNLVQLYKIQKGKGSPQTNPKIQQMLKRQAMNVPLPAAVAGGENPPTLTDEDIFNESMAREGRKATQSVLWRNKPR